MQIGQRSTAHTSIDTVEDLLLRYRSGEAHALDRLIHLMRPVVVKAIRQFVSCQADVDDALQETWMAFVRSGHRIEDARCVRSWLWTTASNAARRVSVLRSRNTLIDDFERIAETSATATIDPDFAGQLARRERSAAVRHALTDGPAADRELLTLLMDDRELGYEQISAITHRPIGSLGPTRERAIRRLRAHPEVVRMAESAA